MDSEENKKIDKNSAETNEWLDSLDSIIKIDGINRAKFILKQLLSKGMDYGINLKFNPNTDYINSIHFSEQSPYPGDRDIERKIKSIIRWNAMAMVVRANTENAGIGGHISSFASSINCLPFNVTLPSLINESAFRLDKSPDSDIIFCNRLSDIIYKIYFHFL